MARSGAPSARKKLLTSQDQEQARRFRTSAFRPPPLIIEIGGRDYDVDSDIDIEVMRQIQAFQEITKTGSDTDVIGAFQEGKELLHSLLSEQNEDVPPVKDLRVKFGQLTAIFVFLLGGKVAAEEIAEAFAVGDMWGAEDEDGEAAEGLARPESEGDPEAEPVPLAKRSKEPSSGSDTSTTGRRSGGKGSPGASSRSTSAKKKQAAA